MAVHLGTKSPLALPGSSPSGLELPKKAKLTPVARATLQALDGPRAQPKADLPFDPQPEGNVWTAFPLHDLGLIRTVGRHGQAFRLDSGSLRGMALMARRVVEQGNTGFEISFEARGNAGETYRRRLVDRGAKTATCTFRVATADESTEGKSRLVEGDGASAVSGEALVLEQPGRWRVSFVAHKPEALRGALRIRVYGDDKAATEALGDVILRLGLQSAFAPPAQPATDRLKLLRSLWAAHPEIQLGYRGLEELAPAIEQACHREGVPPPTRAPLSPEEAGLFELALRLSPRALIHILDDHRASFEAGTSFSSTLVQELRLTLEVSPQTAELAKKTEVSPERAATMLRLATLAVEAPATALALVARDVEGLKPAQLEAALASHGIDTSPARLAELSINEVYPGYFTVYDPKLAEAAEQAGAAYLYSTADNPERVHGILSGGQKSSLTRYAEGILIEGMSSAEDFNTGGARSVFSRLVTRSAIERARASTETGSKARFNDWGGERPYKLILDRRILGRTDWYGFTGDCYGDTKKVTGQNRGTNIIQAIDQKYSASNEIMFPFGNDPKFVRGVVTSTEEQREQLIAYLTQRGITEIQGRPLVEAIMVSSKLCALPEDCTPAMSAEDAVYQGPFRATVEAAAAEAIPAAAAALRTEIEVAARPLVEGVASAVHDPYLDNVILGVGRQLIGDRDEAINAIAGPVAQQLAEEARDAARNTLESSLASFYDFCRPAVFADLTEKLSMSSSLRDAATAAIAAGQAAGQSAEELRSGASAAMQSAVDASLEGAAPKVAEAILSYLHSQLVPAATADLRYAPFMDGLGGHAPPGTLDALAKELMEAGRAEAQSKAGETYVSEWSTSAAYLAAGQDVVLMSKAAARAVNAAVAEIAPRLADEVAPLAEEAARTMLKARGQSLGEDALSEAVGRTIDSIAQGAAEPLAKSAVQAVFSEAARLWATPLAIAHRDERVPQIVETRGPEMMKRAVNAAVQARVVRNLGAEVEAVAKELVAPEDTVASVTARYRKDLQKLSRTILTELLPQEPAAG